MLKVVMDGFQFVGLRGGAGGAGSYFLSLVGELAKLTETRIVASPHNARHFAPLQKQFRRLTVHVGNSGHAEAIAAAVHDADILYAPFTDLPERDSYGQIPAVAAIHDLQHWQLKSFFPEPERGARDDAYFNAALSADAIMTFSEVERANIVQRYNFDGPIGVVPHAPFLYEDLKQLHPEGEYDNSSDRFAQKFGNYILYPAVNWPHKNHYRLLEAFRFWCDRASANDLKLILTGAPCVEQRQHFYRRFLDQPWARERVVELGFVSSVQLFLLMKAARALVFPSLYEGFGIPVLEALRIGTPVIASDLPVMREWFGDCYWPFRDTRDSHAMAEDLSEFLDNTVRRTALREAGLLRGREFSSRRMAQETLEFLSSVAENFGTFRRQRSRAARDLSELRRKSCRILFHVLADTSEPADIKGALTSAQLLREEGDIGFVFILPYPRRSGTISMLDQGRGADPCAAWQQAVSHSSLGDSIYVDPAEGSAGLASTVQFYAASEVDAPYHCFITATALSELGTNPTLRKRYTGIGGGSGRISTGSIWVRGPGLRCATACCKWFTRLHCASPTNSRETMQLRCTISCCAIAWW